MLRYPKVLLATWVVALTCCGVVAQSPPSPDTSLLQPSDISYADATEFARFLNQHAIAVKSVHRSKLESFFRGANKAAFFKTDQGFLEVIFFPDDGAEKVSVTAQLAFEHRIYYSFRGQPQPNPPADTFLAARPMYFITHRSWFIVTLDEKTYNTVKSLF